MTSLDRRLFLKTAAWVTSGAAADFFPLNLRAQENGGGQLRPAQVLLDMVHNNPGETPFGTHYNDPPFLKNLGYQGKVYELFEGAQFGINWDSVDPDIFPAGSPARAWVDQKTAQLQKWYSAVKNAGLSVFCHTDMIVFPKGLVEKYKLTHFGDVQNLDTQHFLRAAIQQMFSTFPQLDGLVIRIGETYLQGAPYHVGSIETKNDAAHTIIPLMQILREEVCEKLNKKVFFRAWLSFDTNEQTYLAVSNGIDPHANLAFVVKHCENDFQRGNPFSKVLGQGRQPQIVEVQCQREYEGKGSYPNYIAHGVIEGFEEHHGQSIRQTWANPLIIGMFTWSRGGGWAGPYITNELWCDVNAYVLSHWAQTPNRTEEEIFLDYATKVLQLSPPDADSFRKLCLLSADAVYRGIRSTRNDINPLWTLDSTIGLPPLPKGQDAIQHLLDEKKQSVDMWTQIVALAQSIRFPDPQVAEYAVTSSQYGLYLFQVFQAGFQLVALGMQDDKSQIQQILKQYDDAWSNYQNLKRDHPSCASLYKDDVKSFGASQTFAQMIAKYRAAAAA
jgi:hypothetical protein